MQKTWRSAVATSTDFLKFARKTENTISPLKFIWKGETLWLSERRCIFWEEEKILIISDPHFGKTGHFRKSGINVPQKSFQEDLIRLFEIIQFFKPASLLINGDLFHSSYNKEIDHFFRWRQNVPDLEVILVKGNHDKFPNYKYEAGGIEVHEETWCRRQFCFAHDFTTVSTGLYLFSGHIHPGVRIIGMGKQSLRLPCFFFGSDYAILPAFGNFTGSATLPASADDVLFAITQREVIQL